MRPRPSDVGARAEAAIAAALVAAGKEVFVPLFSAHSRVDLVFADGGGLHRVQCKSAARCGDVLVFKTCSVTSRSPRSYAGEIDFFGVYSPDLGCAFLVPIGDVSATRAASLRLSPTRNGQSRGVRFARDYLIEPV